MKKKFDINRVKEFCALINEGNTPNRALIIMRSSNGYITPLKNAGVYWKEKDGTYKAVERVRVERYELFKREKINYNRVMKTKSVFKQNTLFNQPKAKTPDVWTQPVKTQSVKTKTKQLSFLQRVVKSLFKL